MGHRRHHGNERSDSAHHRECSALLLMELCQKHQDMDNKRVVPLAKWNNADRTLAYDHHYIGIG